jgi:outer membrane protein assembly factor BamB
MSSIWPMYNQCKEQTSWAKYEKELYPPFDEVNNYDVNDINTGDISYFGGILYISSNQGPDPTRVIAADPVSLSEIWAFEIPNTVHVVSSTPTVNDSLLFCGGQKGLGLYALNRFTGQEVWLKEIGSLLGHHPILDGNRIFVVRDSLFCLDVKDGSTVWSYYIPGYPDTPTIDDLNVYISNKKDLYVFDKITGDLNYKVSNTGQSISVNQFFLYSIHENQVLARDKSNGDIGWSYSFIDSSTVYEHRRFAITDSILCFFVYHNPESKAELIALDCISGDQLWKHTFDSTQAYPPAIANGVVYMVDRDPKLRRGALWGFDLLTGDSLFYDDSQSYDGQPIIGGHMLFVPTSYNGVRVFSNPSSDIQSDQKSKIPNDFHMAQNYPNPFNSETVIRFQVAEPCEVILKVYNLLGEEVIGLIQGQYQAGEYKIYFDSTGLSSGVYFYRIQMGEFREVRKMVVVE